MITKKKITKHSKHVVNFLEDSLFLSQINVADF